MRNPFHRDFTPDSLLHLEKEMQKEILEERIHQSMIIVKKNKEEEKLTEEEIQAKYKQQ